MAKDNAKARKDAAKALHAESAGQKQLADEAGKSRLEEVPQEGDNARFQAQHTQHVAGAGIFTACIADIHALPVGDNGTGGNAAQQICRHCHNNRLDDIAQWKVLLSLFCRIPGRWYKQV